VGLALAALTWIARLVRGETRVARLPLDGALIAFAVWTLLSASFSPDPVASHGAAKQLLLFVLLYVTVDSLAEPEERERALAAVLVAGVCLSTLMVLQFHLLGFDTMDRRPRGFLGHYMTGSGLCMGALVLAAARLAFGERPARPEARDVKLLGLALGATGVLAALKKLGLFATDAERLVVAALAFGAMALVASRGWPGPRTTGLLAAAALPLCMWALVVSRTRNAWLGAAAGLAVVAFLRAPRTLLLVPAAGLLLLLPVVRDRLTLSDASSLDRLYMWQAGSDMIRDRPMFGQGPGRVEKVYPEYRWPGAPNPNQPHLHNNALQIAAERGLPAVAFWLWWVATVIADGWRRLRDGDASAWAAAAAVPGFAALMAAGLFEYNFGDAEVLMFTVLVSALPYAVGRGSGTEAPLPS
jgi:O-antigen ligase